jgi:uncharacterized SAM-binding protein YcdF (DUF218 family)
VSAWELTNVTARLVLPPGLFILVALVGLAFARTRVRAGATIALVSLLALLALCLPVVSTFLIQSLEQPYSDPAGDKSGGAIVVLGGGSYHRAPEYEGDTVGRMTLERLRYGALLQRRTGKPILVSGGNPASAQTSEAEQMKNALKEFGASVKWSEDRSFNTYENALFTRDILLKAGIRSVYLVTHAWHMPRARMAFERAGLHVIPASTAYHTRRGVRLLDFIPSAHALDDSYYFFHEVLGMVWYRLKFDLAREGSAA